MLQRYINSVKIIDLYLKNAKHTIHIIKWSKNMHINVVSISISTQWFVELHLARALKRKHYISVEHGYHGNVYYEVRVYTAGRVFTRCHLLPFPQLLTFCFFIHYLFICFLNTSVSPKFIYSLFKLYSRFSGSVRSVSQWLFTWNKTRVHPHHLVHWQRYSMETPL